MQIAPHVPASTHSFAGGTRIHENHEGTDLRHTAATLLLSSGVTVKVVRKMLGDADISITLRVYAHVTPHMQQAATDVMDRIYGTRPA